MTDTTTAQAEVSKPEAMGALTLSEDVIEKLQRSVEFRDRADLHAFVSDALNTYLTLGHLHKDGRRFYAASNADDLVRLRLPFDQDV